MPTLSLKKNSTELEIQFEKFFSENYEVLCNYAFLILGDYDEAEDLVQEVFAKIWINKTDVIKDEIGLAYFYRSVKNGCLDKKKHDLVKQKYENEFASSNKNFFEILTDFELPLKVEAAVNKLPEQCQRIFRMSRYEGLKYKEIAKKLNISEATVNTQIHRALSVMKKELKDYLILSIDFFFIFMS